MKLRLIAVVAFLLISLSVRAQESAKPDPSAQLQQAQQSITQLQQELNKALMTSDAQAVALVAKQTEIQRLQQQIQAMPAAFIALVEKGNPGKTVDLATGVVKDKPKKDQ